MGVVTTPLSFIHTLLLAVAMYNAPLSLPPSLLSPSLPLSLPSRAPTSSRAMKLGKKGKDVESFVDKLVAEGESKSCRIAPVWL